MTNIFLTLAQHFAISVLEKYGLGALEKYGLGGLEKYGLGALEKYGLGALEKYTKHRYKYVYNTYICSYFEQGRNQKGSRGAVPP